MTNWNEIERITKKITDNMVAQLGNVHEIANGYCAVWAKKVFNALKEVGIDSEIVVNDVFDLEDELEGFDTIEAEYCEGEYSHCYIKVDGWFFDAFDVDGVESEGGMSYFNEIYNYNN